MPSGFQVDEMDLFWAALTVGRPNLQAVQAHGQYSVDEANYRIAMVKANLRLDWPGSTLMNSPAFNALDPTEKGWVNFSLGMIFTKISASKFLNIAWLMHFKWFDATNSVMKTAGNSTPDFIGVDPLGCYHALEAKGRNSGYLSSILHGAKEQADQVILVNGQPATLHIGALLYRINKESLAFAWRDPEPDTSKEEIQLKDTRETWREYYRVVWGLHRLSQKQKDFFETQTGVTVRLNAEVVDDVSSIMSDDTVVDWELARDRIKEWSASDFGRFVRAASDEPSRKRIFADGTEVTYSRPVRERDGKL